MLSLFLARGADLGIRGGGGLTVEDAFRRTGRLEIADCLHNENS